MGNPHPYRMLVACAALLIVLMTAVSAQDDQPGEPSESDRAFARSAGAEFAFEMFEKQDLNKECYAKMYALLVINESNPQFLQSLGGSPEDYVTALELISGDMGAGDMFFEETPEETNAEIEAMTAAYLAEDLAPLFSGTPEQQQTVLVDVIGPDLTKCTARLGEIQRLNATMDEAMERAQSPE